MRPGSTGQGSLRPSSRIRRNHPDWLCGNLDATTGTGIIDLLFELNSEHGATLVLVTHPFEFIHRDDFRYRRIRPNRLVQARLEGLCQYLVTHNDRFEVTTFGDLAATLPLQPSAPPPLRGAPLRALQRAVQNFINDRL